jgi:hypothetical protein
MGKHGNSDMRKLAIAALGPLCFAFAAQAAAEDPRAGFSIGSYKKYAFSECVSRAFEAGDAGRDAAASAKLYQHETGPAPDAAFTAAAALAETYLKKSGYGMKIDEPPYNIDASFAKCIDLYHSKELDVLAGKFTKSARDRK